jgi:hypothetical protein
MRKLLVISLFALAGCYNPGDLGANPFYCSNDYPDCPDGYVCDFADCTSANNSKCQCCLDDGTGNCVAGTGSAALSQPLTITKPLAAAKGGVFYSGAHMDPGLATCHETTATSLSSPYEIGDSAAPVTAQEICPAGDVDLYVVHLDPGESLLAWIQTPGIAYGDLDMGFFDEQGRTMITSAVDVDATRGSACVTLPRGAPAGDYLLAVVGAPNKMGTLDVNKYDLKFERGSSTPLACDNGTPAPPSGN